MWLWKQTLQYDSVLESLFFQKLNWSKPSWSSWSQSLYSSLSLCIAAKVIVLLHASSFIAFNKSNAEIIILNDIKVWKKCIYDLNRETDHLVKMKQQDKSEIQQLKAQLQAFTAITVNVIIIAFSIIIYFEWFKYHKILNSLMFTDEKNSTWKNWFLDIWKKLAMNVDIFLNELYKLSYINFQLANDIVEVTQVRCNFNCDNFYLTINELLKKLAQSFHDSDKKDNYRRKYINLIQESKKFSDFFN